MNRKPPIRIQKRLKVLRHDSSGTRILFSHQQSKNIYKILRIYSANMKNISKNAIIGYPAGIITGITYGLNPLFGVPLMKEGAAIESILFFRYAIAVLFLSGFLLLSRQSFKISWKQAGVLLILGLLYTSSSVFLFEAYNYIASGLATTIIFLYPVLVAIIMVFLRVVPSCRSGFPSFSPL